MPGKDSAKRGAQPSLANGQWPSHGGDDSEQRYSTLKQINADNVADLGLAWFADFAERGGYQTTPIFVDGIIYATTPWSKVYAFDARTGQQLWRYDPQVPRELAATSLCCNVTNRGAAYANGKIIWATLDGRLLAVDAKQGSLVWEAQTTDPDKPLSITGAPRIGNGLVFIGQAGAEYHQRGYMSAWDLETGEKAWHFWLVPGDPSKGPDGAASDDVMAMAAETWKGEWWKFGGGATPWDGILYDPVTDLVIFGTGNGAPWPAEVRSPGGGDNLFTAAIVALHAKTGKYAWHYQTVPMDNFDYDNASPLTTAELVINGEKKHVVMQAPKNGFFYVIEAATGKVLDATLFVPSANWLTGFDKANNWKPIINMDSNIGATGTGWHIVPFQTHVWTPQAFNPQTGLMYLGARYASYGMVAEAGAMMGNQMLSINTSRRPEYSAPDLGPDAGSYLLAWDPVNRREAWKSRQGSGSAGTMTTAGNLVFQGTSLAPATGGPGRQSFAAFRADTGELLWSAESRSQITGGSITYMLDGVQYVAVVAGQAGGASQNRLLVYSLNGAAALPPAPPAAAPVAFTPPANFGTDAMRERGRELYTQNCTICHESGARMGGFPDLRSSQTLHSDALFRAIVIDGALTENGMVSFRTVMQPEDAEAIRAHLTQVANERTAGGPGGGFGGGGGGPRGGGAGPALPPQPPGGMIRDPAASAPLNWGANGQQIEPAGLHQ